MADITKASTTKFGYKESLVKEMKELVDSFYSNMSTKILQMKKRQVRKMTATNLIDTTNDAKSSDNTHGSSSTTPGRNPAHSSIMKPGDSSRRLVHSVTVNSILQQSREWPLPSSDSLHNCEDTLSIDSSCPAMERNDQLASSSSNAMLKYIS